MSYELEFAIMANSIFIGYLVWVSWQDYKEMQVIRYSHGLGLIAVIILAIGQRNVIAVSPLEYLLGLVMVFLVQLVAHRCKIYGMADVIVFFMCGLFLLLQKGTAMYMTAYFMVIAVSGCLLLLVQIFKHNLKGVYLYKPVPYIPYICFAFVLTNVVV